MPALELAAGLWCLVVASVVWGPRSVFLGGAIFALLLGWRGLEVTPGFRIYPAEPFLWLGAAMLLPRLKRRVGLPWQAWMLSASALSAWLLGMVHNEDVGLAFAQTRAFLTFIPVLILAGTLIESVQDVWRLNRWFVYSGTVIAALALIEFYVPSVVEAAPWLFKKAAEIRANFGSYGVVQVAGFSFWGGSIVSVILVPVCTLTVVLLQKDRGAARLRWGVALAILVASILISGYRSSWVGLIVGIAVLCVVSWRTLVLAALCSSVVISKIDDAFVDRFRTVLLLNNSGDTSILRRANAISNGLEALSEHWVLGAGWSSPFVFNDWLYLAICLGVPAFAVFAQWYGQLLWRLLMLMLRWDPPGEEAVLAARGFFAGLAGYAACMISGAMTQVLPLMVAFWILFCLAIRCLEVAARPGHVYACPVPFLDPSLVCVPAKS